MSSSSPGGVLCRRSLDAVFGIAEAVAALSPLLVLTPQSGLGSAAGVGPGAVLLRLVPGALALFGAAALLWAAHRTTPSQPLRELRLRTLLVVSAAALLGAAAVRMGLPAIALLLVIEAAALCTPLLEAFRLLLLEVLAERTRPASGDDRQAPGPATPERLRTITDHLVLASLGTTAPTLGCALLLCLASAHVSSAQLARLLLVLPPVTACLFLIWRGWLSLYLRPLRAALAVDPGRRGRQDRGDRDLPSILRALQRLPTRLGVAKLVLYSVAALVLSLVAAKAWALDLGSALLLAGETVLLMLGASLYEVPWQRATLAPLLSQLALLRAAEAGGAVSLLRAPVRSLSLRAKLLWAFGTLTVLSCGLALLWSTQQHRAVAARYTRTLAHKRLAALLEDVRRLPPHPSPERVAAALRDHPRADVVVEQLPVGSAVEPDATYLPALHRYALSAELRGPQGEQLGRVRLLQSRDAPEEQAASEAPIIAMLVAFFVLLLLAAIAILGLIAADLTRPIRELERRAADVAQGDLRRPLYPVAVEGDELGRLQQAFEDMREALAERLRSSTEVHYMLETQVTRRTEELSRRNRELKEALDELQRAQTELIDAERMASMGRLIAGIAHEINNPVNAVLNAAGPLLESLQEMAGQLAQGGASPASPELLAAADDMLEMVGVVQRGARRTREIVQALHHYARGDGGDGGDGGVRVVDLHRCLNESLDLLQHHLRSGIRVHKEYGITAEDAVAGHSGQLQQVFMNLLTNAAQALAPLVNGDPPPEIRIATRREGGSVVVEIADNGPGIPPEVVPRIFDPFFTTKEVGQGSGLGLSIVHGILERHGGAINVSTAVGQGTRMLVRLPVQPAA